MDMAAATDQYPDVPRYLGTGGVAGALGVSPRTVSAWIRRYPPGSVHPVPAPDVIVADMLGWAADRLPEWRAWRAGMPGRGAGGGRPRTLATGPDDRDRDRDHEVLLATVSAWEEQYPPERVAAHVAAHTDRYLRLGRGDA